MSDDTRSVWTLVDGTNRPEPLLVGRRLARDWLTNSEDIVSLRFAGATRQALAVLLEAARVAKTFLPIVSLRVLLASRLDGLITLERDLGLSPQNARSIAAELRPPYDNTLEEMPLAVESALREWLRESLEPWAGRHESLARPVAALRTALRSEDCQLSPEQRALAADGRVDYPLIARSLGDLLAGEELFEGCGPCELVLSPEYRGNRIELMTRPIAQSRNEVFSMVARISVVTVPYSSELLLSVSAIKRNWSRRLPANAPSVPGRATGYVMSPGRPVMPVPIERGENGWAFGDGYLSLLRESENRLPESLAAAVERRTVEGEDWWFAGLPELPALYPNWRLAQRSVLEVDEVDLLERVSSLLKPCLDPRGIDFSPVRVARMPRRGEAGTLGPADLEDDGEEAGNAERIAKIERIRAQNQDALAVAYPGQRPILWVLTDYAGESRIIEQVTEKLFGDAVELRPEPLPSQTHGLRDHLEARDQGPRSRFEARLARWSATVQRIRAESAGRPSFVLVCAPDVIGRKPEDHVNMYAGIHALAGGGANLHYLLPMAAGSDEQAARESFIYRTQSALLDVLLAHAGIVLDSAGAVSSQLPSGAVPRAIYGVQAVRSRARPKSGERGANFLLFTRLIIASGLTEAKIAHRGPRGNLVTDWMPLPRALCWIGSQRSLTDGDANWLSANFPDITRDVLQAIAADDPHAVVLVDWGTVRGLWKGISDADLSPGAAPKLAGADLSRLAQMSFVRLRRGADTIALRRAMHATYAQSREGTGREATGVSEDGTYYTTGKSIVEISPPADRMHHHGHFVASMGYAQTVQALRGMSCYRSMPRFRKPKGGEKSDPDYERVLLSPANKDIALPAPLDITVMSCPAGTAPEDLARLILELRRGFAHYDDWTALPAPLFFRRKVDDYIIRFAEDSSAVTDEETTVVLDMAEPLSLTGLQADDLAPRDAPTTAEAPGDAVALEQAPVAVVPISDSSTATPVVDGLQKDSEDSQLREVPSGDALVLSARAADYPPFEPSKSINERRLYRGMIQERLRVRVDPPYWISQATCLEANRSLLKRGSRRAWARGIEYGFIASGQPCPSDLLGWLSRKLVIPQAAFALRAISREIGGIWFEPLWRIIEDEYNPSVDDDAQVDPAGFDPASLARMTHWAQQHNHDRLMAWLVFQVAQFPVVKWLPAVFCQMSSPPGPLTEEALRYFLQCADALRQARSQGAGAFVPVILMRRRPPASAKSFHKAPTALYDTPLPQPSCASVSSYAPPQFVPAPAVAISEPADTVSTVLPEDPVMAAKAELADLFSQIHSLAPGDARFVDLANSIEGRLAFLRDCHQAALDAQAAQAQTLKRRDTWRSGAEQLIGDLSPYCGDLGLAGLSVRPDVGDDALTDALDEQMRLQNLLSDLSARQAYLEQLDSLPPPRSMQERSQRTRESDVALGAAMAVLDQISELLAESINYISTPRPADPPPTPPTTPEPESSPTAEAATPEPVTSEPTPTAEAVAHKPAPPESTPPEAAPPEPTSLGETGLRHAVKNEAGIVLAATAVEVSGEPDEVPQRPAIGILVEQAATAAKLFDKRLYTLAGIHADALARMLTDNPDDTARSHQQLLDAIVDTLEAADCRDFFGEPFTPEFIGLLDELPSSSDCRPLYVGLGLLAASLPALVLLADVQTRWLPMEALAARLTTSPQFASLISIIGSMHETGLFPTREMFAQSHADEALARGREVQRMETVARTWKDGGELYSGFSHRGFIKMHMLMFGPKHPIGQCVEAIARGNPHRVDSLYREHKRRFDKAANTVTETFRSIGELNQPDGAFRNATIENIRRTQTFIERYLSMAHGKEAPRPAMPAPIADFLRDFHDALTLSMESLEDLVPENFLEACYVMAARRTGDAVIRLYRADAPPACLSQDQQRLLLQLPLDLGLSPVLGHGDWQPGLCTPDMVFSEAARLAEDLPRLTNKDASEEIKEALADALAGHLSNKRFLPAFRLDRLLDGQSAGTLAKAYEDELDKLEALAQDSRQRVTHALALNTLGNAQAGQMLRVVDEVLMQLGPEARIGKPDLAAGRYCDFPQASMALRHHLIVPLEKFLADRVAEIESELDEYVVNHPVTRSSDVQRIQTLLASRNASEILTACDLYNLLKEYGSLPPQTEGYRDIAEEYAEFLRQVRAEAHGNQRPLDELALRLGRPADDGDPPWLASLDGAARKDALAFIDAWRNLFSRHAAPGADEIDRFFSHLGILPPTLVADRTGHRRVQLQFDERAFSAASHAAAQLFLPPVLGSQARNLGGYLLFGNPKPEDLRQNIQQLQAKNIAGVVLARMRLSMADRASLSGDAQALVIDDDLVAYAALQLGQRFSAVMRIALLTFQTNPYKDWGRDPVPPEMFFGRQRELDRLRGVSGLAVLYGGRRLGKTSLLRQIELDAQDKPGVKAVALSLLAADKSPGAYIDSCWDSLYSRLVAVGLVAPVPRRPAAWREISSLIEMNLRDRQEIRELFLLIDEADEVMACELDARPGTVTFVQSLQNMATNLANCCRVHYIIAGLHNMTRMTTVQNSPFGQAQSIRLEPFNSPDDVQRGIRLITQPLAGLGYLFEKGDLPMRILSVCNFYPAFIQIYCQHLVDHMWNVRNIKKPPSVIRVDDLNAVERNPQLIHDLREKFRLNLDLDKRYKAIALILADDYYSSQERPGSERGMTTETIRGLCGSLAGSHFNGTGQGAYDALLEEMVTLNLLERNGSSWELRNPGVAMMLGERESILSQLSELSLMRPEASRSHGERRIEMAYAGNDQHRIPFPMPVSWVRRNLAGSSAKDAGAPDSDIIVLAGNTLSGLGDLINLDPGEYVLQEGVFRVIPGTGPQAVQTFLASSKNSRNKRPHLAALRAHAWQPSQLPEMITHAQKLANYGRRLVLLAPPEQSWPLAKAIAGDKIPAPGNGWRVDPVAPWNEDAVYFRLQENTAVADSKEALAAILEATCGFGKQVQSLCQSSLSRKDALDAPARARTQFALDLATLFTKIGLPSVCDEDWRKHAADFLGIIPGTERNSADVAEALRDCALDNGDLLFLYWMGLLQEGPGNTWQTPKLVEGMLS